MRRTDAPIIISQPLTATRQQLWAVLTELDHMRKWFFENLPDFKAEKGFKTRFDVKSETCVFPHLWEVLEVIPEQSITTQWKYDGYFGICTVMFNISGADNKHIVSVEAVVLEDFDDSIPEFKRESAVGGWTFFINQRLKDYIEKLK